MEGILTILLAGGAGERLAPLTRNEPKPMMPFGGIYRLIDLTLSNCLNSGLNKIYVLTQYKALSLNRHIRQVWNILSPELGQFIEAVPPTQRLRNTWYLGTADAVYQNMQSIVEEHLPYVLILSADHVYKMNYAHMLDWHVGRGADVTVATTRINPSESARFGIVNTDEDYRIRAFDEKPTQERAARSRFNQDACSASMGVYLFSTPVLLEALMEDAADDSSSHDFGGDVLPKLIGRRRVVAYDFVDENKKEMVYWRDVGTLESYFEANQDLVAVTPEFNLYDQEWPLRTSMPPMPPAKFVFAQEGQCMGLALDSIVSHGCIISGGRVVRSVLSPGVRVDRHASVENCLLFSGVQIGAHARIRNAIVDHNVKIPEHAVIGLDPETNRREGHTVTESGLVIVHADSPGVSVQDVPRRPVASEQGKLRRRARAGDL
ncbi:MAG TPA: glucose-1-phosphate adenylyltransferase [Bryobacteraceae bacterium]|nr:glucose-1-phosphate adenylyltransferase [Bryobacteraceae bacterium]